MGRAERDKGARWEREVARHVREYFGEDARRGAQCRDGADTPDVIGMPGYWPECKASGRGINAIAALAQAARAAHGTELTPVVFAKVDRKAPIAILDMDDFLELAAFAHREQGER